MIQSERKAVGTVNSLRRMFETNDLNDFALRRAMDEGQDLINKGFGEEGSLVLAMVDSLNFDVESFQRNYSYIQQTSADGGTYVSLINCLQRLGFRNEAFGIAKGLVDMVPDDIELLKVAMSVSVQTAKFKSYHHYTSRLEKLGYRGHIESDFNRIDIVGPTITLMDELNIDENDYNEVVELASSILRNKKIPALGVLVDTSLDGSVSMRYVTPLNVVEAVNISFEIADSIISRFENNYSELLTLGCAAQDELPTE